MMSPRTIAAAHLDRAGPPHLIRLEAPRFWPRLHLPLRVQLTGYVIAFLVILATLGGLSVDTLNNVTSTARTLDTKWLASSRLLDQLSEEVAHFRLAETYRALEIDSEGM